MKRKANLYEDILNYDNILLVANDVLKTNRNKAKSLEFSRFLHSNVCDIKNRLLNNEYEFSKYRVFMIKDPKYRIIMSEVMSDKIVNHLVSRYILLPSIEKCNIDTNVATRIGKGSKYAFSSFCKYVNKIGVNKKIYVLKIDISKYFYNIDHDVLVNKIKRKIKDPRALKIVFEILKTTNYNYINNQIISLVNHEIKRTASLKISYKEKLNIQKKLSSIPLYQTNKGLPIGNMTSQLLAVFYLNDVDHYIKETLSLKYYIRYMDDLVILDTDKNKLLNCLGLIKEKIEEHKLKINSKSMVYELDNGVSFLGYTFKNKYNTLWIRYQNRTIRKIARKLKKYKVSNYNLYYRSIASYKGYFKNSNTSLFCKELRKKGSVNIMYNKYLEVKKDFKDSILFIKSGKFYRTYDDDAVIMNYLFCYQIIDNKVGFPLESLFKVKSRLKSNNISYIIVDGNDIFNEECDNNCYCDILISGTEKYEKNLKIEELIHLVRERLNEDISLYDNFMKLITK